MSKHEPTREITELTPISWGPVLYPSMEWINDGDCISCGGNNGYGPAPHHMPDCYFASWEDTQHDK